MKVLKSLILGCLVVMPALFGRAQINSPGWYHAIISGGTNQSRSSFTASGFQSEGLIYQAGVPSTPVAEIITPQIQALANGLQDNPQRIFDYVHDHIKYVLYYGSKKGAELTLLEKSGNDFDQAALLMALLQAAGYTNALYQFGWMEIPYDDPNGQHRDLHHWWQLTLNNTNWTTTETYLGDLAAQRAYPQTYYSGSNIFELQRVWVVLTIGTNTYSLDPAFKVSELVSGISLTNAIGDGAISNTLLSAAAGTNTGNFAQNLNEAALRNDLAGYTTNLLNYFQNNAPNTSVQQILGGWQIIPATTNDFSLNLTFTTDTFNGRMPVLSWIYEPTNMMSTLQITFVGTNYQWYIPQLQGQRLSLVFSNNGVAQLWQEDNLLVQAASSGSGSTNVGLYVHHPCGYWDTTNNVLIQENYFDDMATNAYQSTNAMYALVYAFEPDWGWLQQRDSKLDAYALQGLTNGTRQVTTETLNIMGLNWMLQTAQAEQMLAMQVDVLPQYYHRIGRMAQEAGHGYYLDIYMDDSGSYPNGGDDAPHMQLSNVHSDVTRLFASALENGVLEQLQNSNIVAASTVKMLEIANTNDQPIYLASNTNWNTGYNVENYLTNYPSTALAIIASDIEQGEYVLLPQNGSNHVSGAAGSWSGYGYWAHDLFNGWSSVYGMVISGHYGGQSGVNGPVNPSYVQTSQDAELDLTFGVPNFTPPGQMGDPLDSADDTFELAFTDLSLGGTEPRGIALTHYYNGIRRFSNPAGMTGGWVHNYCITANNLAAPQACLGGTTPAQASCMLTATAAAIATYNGGYPDPKNWMTTALIAKWGVDQITKSGIFVNLGKDTLQFVQQPNGIFTPPANSTATLVLSNSAYSLLMRHGNRFNFNVSGYLANIVDQYGQSLNLTYNASNWVSTIKDWKNRTLTFNYSGTPSRLTSVSDGTRSVSYGYSTAYSPQGDMTAITDAESKTSTYSYDTNHQITASLDALNRLVVSNVYDTQGRVVTQYTEGLPSKTWQFYWSGWQNIEQDPMGNQRTFIYDDEGRLSTLQDQLGNVTHVAYDGQNHLVMEVSPLGETNWDVYDSSNNIIQTIDPLGFTNQYFYDANNNLICFADARGNTNYYAYNAEYSLITQTNSVGDWINYNYNANGTIASKTDAGGMTMYNYNVTFGQLTNIIYPNGLGSEGFANNVFGDVTNHTDGRGFSTGFSYNNRRQLTNSVGPTNLFISRVTFDAAGNNATIMDSRGNSSSNIWSATRLLMASILPNTSQGVPVTTNIYDAREWLMETIDPNQQSTLYTNDAAHRLIAQTDPLLRTTQHAYDADGRKLLSINAANETNSQTWDSRGSLIKACDGAGHFSTRVYDAMGNQINLTNRNGNGWQFQFDAANRLTNTITPLGRSSSIVFNHQGLPILIIDPSTQMTTNTYDGRARLVTRADKIGVTINLYDANNNLTNLIENGRTNAWTYDAYNRVSSYKDIYGNLIQYRHDANGNVTNLIYPDGKVVAYAYDSLNRLTNVMDWSGRKTAIAYDLDNRIKSIKRPNGSSRTVSYDADGEATNILEQMSNSLPIALFEYDWTNSGNMAWEFIAPLPHTNTPSLRTMAYNADNQLTNFNGQTVTEDLDGNLTNAPLTNATLTPYVYDARNRLSNAGGVTNIYDAMNNRIGQMYGTNSTVYVVNPNAKLPQVLMRIKNGVTNYYIYGAGLLYQITEATNGTNTLTYHYDYRGSTVALSGDNGIVTDRIEYSAYGLTVYRIGTNDTPFLCNGRYGIQSDYNGLLYMRARYYNPYLCRFINGDPSGFNGGLNFYAFANGNPISHVDPSGLQIPSPANLISGWSDGSASNPTVWDSEFQNINQEAGEIEMSVDAGAAFGAVGAAAVGFGAAGLVELGVSQSFVTGGLLISGSVGFIGAGYSIYEDPSIGNIGFTIGSLGGSIVAGNAWSEFVASSLSPSGYQPSTPASMSSDVSMAWKDANGNISPVAFFLDWFSPNATVGPMSTGPSILGAAATIAGDGVGISDGFNYLTGQQVDWFGNPISSSPTGKP